jgi:AmmeMemoRadiSam system protein B/AmmeMemoRadiSam system protein A
MDMNRTGTPPVRGWRSFTTILTLMLALGGVMTDPPHTCEAGQEIRPAAVAGQFYPGSAAKLRKAIENYLADALPGSGGAPLALIAPHAGYIYSGQICADAYNQARQQPYDTVVILGTNHTAPRFGKIGLYPGAGFQTPLGIARVNTALVAELLAASPDCVRDAAVHTREHSVEVQVPFIQVLYPQATIVPAVVGQADISLCSRFGETLARLVKGRRVLIVASTDLSHYPSYEEAVRIDGETLAAIRSMDPTAVQRSLSACLKRRVDNLHTGACGEGPILVAMFAAKALGAQGARVVSYANSGDAAIGEPQRVVGYGAVAFLAQKTAPEVQGPAKQGTDLTPEDRKALLSLARKTITWYLDTQTVPLARRLSPAAQGRRGVFVTLKKRGQLRGCIGRIVPDAPLPRLVGAMALQSALHDPRFPSVSADEMKDIEVELSVLSPIRSVSGPQDIVVGRDGVILQKGGRSAVFLPQVATEQGWTRDEMLDHLALKAGLAPGAWRSGTSFSTFQAVVFSESDRH